MHNVIDLSKYRGRRVAALIFYGAAIVDDQQRLFSPIKRVDFAQPITADQAAEEYQREAREAMRSGGAFFAEPGLLVPWPPAAVRFEWVD